MKILIAIVATLIPATASAGALPAWCGGEKMDANSEELRRLTTATDPVEIMTAIAKMLCTADPDLDPHRGEIETARKTWGKKFGMADADWADMVDYVKFHDGTFKADLSTKDTSKTTPLDQYLAINLGFGDGYHGTDQIYATDVFDHNLTETGRMAFIDWCLKDDDVARADGNMPKWAMCWPDVEKFDMQKIFSEVKSDTGHPGHARMYLRFHATQTAEGIKQVTETKAKFIKKDDTWQKLFDIAAKARADWAKDVGSNTKLLDLAAQMDSAAFGKSRKMLDGCEGPTEAAFAAELSKIPSKTFSGMHDDREMTKPGFAESAGPKLVNFPSVYVAATAWVECHGDNASTDYLSEYLQGVPGTRGPRNAALGAIMAAEPTLKFDDTDAKRLDYPRFSGRPAERSGGAIMSSGGVVKSVKKEGDHLLVQLEKTKSVQEDCVKEHRGGHVAQIRSDGAVEYELICDKFAMVTHDTTWTDFKVRPEYEKVLKPGVVFSALFKDNKPGDVIAIWPTKSAKTPSWILGAPIK